MTVTLEAPRAVAHDCRIIIPLPGDITSAEELKRIAQIVRDETGYINLLIANAGITGPGLNDLIPRATLSDFVAHAWKSPMADFNAVYELNCTAVYYTIIAFLELLDEGNNRAYQVQSQVIATASTAAYLRNPRAGYAYCSSKAALVSMIKCFSSYCVPWGIRFNAIAAGCMYTVDRLFSVLKANRSRSVSVRALCPIAQSIQNLERESSQRGRRVCPILPTGRESRW